MKDFRKTTTITDRESISISRYLRDITQYALLSPEDEAKLAGIIKKGGEAAEKAKERLIQANLRFVISVANQYKRKNMELADLIAEGNIGLLKAVQFFDETRGFKFISYAVWWIRQSIISAICEQSTVLRLPSNQQKMLQEYKRMDNEMLQLEQRHMTLEEFCEIKGIPTERMAQIINANAGVVKMDSPIDSETETTFADQMESGLHTDLELEQESLKHDLKAMIEKRLKPREKSIICGYFGIDQPEKSMETLAEEHSLSRERTRQICLSAIQKLRSSEEAKSIMQYLA